MKKITAFVGILALVFIVSFLYIKSLKKETNASGYMNASYYIDGKIVKLVDGTSETEVAPGSSTKVKTKYFGNKVNHDFDGDGRDDVVFLLTQDSGGSGIFYYVVVAMNRVSGYVGGRATLIGDRISPQITEVNDKGFIVVNYADRDKSESFAVKPSVGKSLILKLDLKNLDLGEVLPDFEGEANPSSMNIKMKTWNWVSTKYSDGKVVHPKSNVFSISFKDGQFSAKTDCNGVGGEYFINGSKILLDKMISTLMYCEGSQESEYTKMLGEIESFMFTTKGELLFGLKYDSGTMTFK